MERFKQVFCACGAAWEGNYAINNPVIAAHHERAATGTSRCRILTHDQFKALHKCRCDVCRATRALARAERKAKQVLA